MPILDDQNVDRLTATWMRDNEEPTDFTKAQLLAAARAANQWVEDIGPTFNAALPAAFRQAASLPQKLKLLEYVLARRGGRLRAEED